MAYFTSTAELNETWRGVWEFRGAAGTQFRLPDSLQPQFDAEMAARIPGLAWVTSDEIGAKAATIHTHAESSVTSLVTDLAGKAASVHSHAESEVTNLATDLAAKIAAAGGTATGAIRLKAGPIFDVRAFGALGNGVADDTAAIQAAIDAASAASGIVHIPAGTYMALSLVGKSDCRIVGEPGALLRKNGGAFGTHVIDFTGSTTATSTTIAVATAIGDTTVSTGAASAFAVGDYVVIWDGTYEYTTHGRNQELNRITAVAASSITVANPLIASYRTSDGAVVKLSAVKQASIENVRIQIDSTTAGGGIYCGPFAYGVEVHGCRIKGPNDDAGIYFYSSAYCKAVGNVVQDGQSVASGGYGYGLIVDESSHGCALLGNRTEAVRENLATNGAKDLLVSGNTFVGGYDSGFNTHGSGCHRIAVVGNNVIGCKQGILSGWAGDPAAESDILFANNIITNSKAHAIRIGGLASTIKARVSIVGNYIRNIGTAGGTANYYGIDVEYASQVLVASNFVSPNAASTAFQVAIFATSSTALTIHGNRCQDISNGRGAYLATVGDSVVSANRFENIASYNVAHGGSLTGLNVVKDNTADDNTLAIDNTAIRKNNIWGSSGSYLEVNGGVISIASGGTVAHGLVAQPKKYGASPTTALRYVSVTGADATKLTFTIHTSAGSAVGVAENIAWWAEV